MKAAGLGKEKTINAFVGSKIKKLGQVDKNMKNMFSFMFSESENVMFEQSDGIKISKKLTVNVKTCPFAARLRFPHCSSVTKKTR